MGRKSRLKKLKKQDGYFEKNLTDYTSPKETAMDKKLKKYNRFTRVMNIAIAAVVIVLSFSIGFGGWAYYFEAPIEAKVGNATIKIEEVENRLLALKNQYRQYGIDPEDTQYASLFVNARSQIVESLIENQLLFQYGKDNNLLISQEELNKRVEEEFENYKNSFENEAEFQKVLENNNMTVEELKSNLAKEFEISMTADKVLEEKYQEITVTKEDVSNYFNELYEVHAEHLLAQVEEGEDKAPEEAVKELAETILTTLKEKSAASGFNFKTFAQEMEKEYPGRLKYEDLGYFAEGKMVIEFHTAAFAMKDGDISQELVKTQFGYHIIHRISHRTRKVSFDQAEEREAYRILFTLKAEATAEEEAAVKNKAVEILTRINRGSKFEDLAKQYSEDEATKENGGLIGYVKKGVRGEVFDGFIFNAKIGDLVKEPLKTSEGYEILKLTAIKPFKEASLDNEETYKRVEEELITAKKQEVRTTFIEELSNIYKIKRGNLWIDFQNLIFGRS